MDLVSGVEDIPEDVDATTYMLITEMRRLWALTESYRSKVFEILLEHYNYYGGEQKNEPLHPLPTSILVIGRRQLSLSH